MYSLVYAQTTYSIERIEEEELPSPTTRTVQNKDANYAKERRFVERPKNKYNDGSFVYVEDPPPKQLEPKETESTPPKVEKKKGITIFGLSPWVFVFILIGVLAIVAIIFKFDFSYFRMEKYKYKMADPLVSQDEDIDEDDYERLLQRATQQQDFRLATRYYYLWLLKKLSQRNYIEYHRDKTNSDYQFELQDDQVRSQFSYLSYIYSYVWYGEFPVDELKFATIKEKYQSFLNQIK
jgi:hypothetical protein